MNQEVKDYKKIFIVAALIIIFVSTTSFTFGREGMMFGYGDIEEGKIRAIAPGGPGFVSLSVFDFTPCSSYARDPIKFEVYNTSDFSSCGLYAPIALPHGATITKLIVYFYDKATNDEIEASLISKPLDGGSLITMAVTDYSDPNTGYGFAVEDTIVNEIIDLQSNAYFVTVFIPSWWGSDLRFVGLRVDYEYTDYMPIAVN